MKNKHLLLLLCSIIATNFIVSNTVNARDLRTRNNIKAVNATMTSSSIGTDVINIIDKNQAGISHNKFDEFNIDGDVIFNNSTVGGNSQIGGYVDANGNLKGAASTIIAEITGNNSSSLAGNLEIFGTKADLLIANQNGIVVNGLNVYNTNNLTLTTGRVSSSDSLFTATQGDITVNGEGVKTVGGKAINLVAESIDINGKVGGDQEKITAITGHNRVKINEDGSLAISNTKKSGGTGLRVGEIGSMHGSSVVLLDTSDIGINSKGVISAAEVLVKSNSDIKLIGGVAGSAIDVAGKNIIASNVSASTINYLAEKNLEASDINATIINLKGNDVVLKGTIAGENLKVSSDSSLKNLGTIKIDNEIKLQSFGDIYNEGLIETEAAKVDINGKNFYNTNNIDASNAKLSIYVVDNFENSKDSSIKASTIDINVAKTFDNKGKIITSGDKNVIAATDFQNSGKLLFEGENRTLLNVGRGYNNNGLISGDVIKLTSNEKVEAGDIVANQLTFHGYQ